MTSTRSIYVFLAGTFALASVAFIGMLFIPNAASPQGWPGLPIWLLAIWSPSLTAIAIAHRQGKLKPLLKKLVTFRFAPTAITLILTPLFVLVAFILASGQTPDWSATPPTLLLVLIAFNFILGPLGEELGWRGLLLPALEIRLGWLGAALVVGLIWTIWHAPLWFFDSPQSVIPFGVFAAHAMFYSILMAAAHRLAPDTLVPAVSLHLLFNVTVALAAMWGITDIASFYIKTLPLYGLAVVLVAGLLNGKNNCPAPDPV